MDALKYLAGYPPALQLQVRELLAQGRVGPMLAERYGVRSVPHLVINGKHHVSGAIGLDQIIEALGKIK